jgi:beta-lactamase class A
MSDVDAHRRRLLACGLALPLLATPLRGAFAQDAAGARFVQKIAALEAQHGGRLGVAALEVASGRCLAHRGDERFLLCSTFKVPAVALVLDRVRRGQESLARTVRIARADLVAHAPVVEQHVGGTLAVAALCDAALTVSDNAAGNLLLRSFGGPAALTAYVRGLGDATTRLDRIETQLNAPDPSGTWDTTSPVAMAGLLRTLLFGNALAPAHRQRLLEWTAASTTGRARLRVDWPATWPAGDKTGTGSVSTNDVAWVRPAGRAPWIVTTYYMGAATPQDAQDAVVAEVGRAFAEMTMS